MAGECDDLSTVEDAGCGWLCGRILARISNQINSRE